MGNAEDTDELIGKTGSGNKHLTVQLRTWQQCRDTGESGKILMSLQPGQETRR